MLCSLSPPVAHFNKYIYYIYIYMVTGYCNRGCFSFLSSCYRYRIASTGTFPFPCYYCNINIAHSHLPFPTSYQPPLCSTSINLTRPFPTTVSSPTTAASVARSGERSEQRKEVGLTNGCCYESFRFVLSCEV